MPSTCKKCGDQSYIIFVTGCQYNFLCDKCYDELYRKDMDPGGGSIGLPAIKKRNKGGTLCQGKGGDFRRKKY